MQVVYYKMRMSSYKRTCATTGRQPRTSPGKCSRRQGRQRQQHRNIVCKQNVLQYSLHRDGCSESKE
ncbi:hypothetical protein BIW11_09376 [Tropilaelaps mercedesae]|uniref:Uncharacterized protein n=1 Tax=Tropilaelaps mercedesae TaxID=418985 RepID=A0A1V9XKC9_9ACAR|nr:hypothetical protein BIW11_09376 [Tropilaelaps mercedesae]